MRGCVQECGRDERVCAREWEGMRGCVQECERDERGCSRGRER